MTKEEQVAFDLMVKKICKSGVMVQNLNLPKEIRLEDENRSDIENELSSTNVVPLVEIVKAVNEFVNKCKFKITE